MTTITDGMTTAEFISALNDNFNAEKYLIALSTLTTSSTIANINTNFTSLKNGRITFVPNPTVLSAGSGNLFKYTLNANFDDSHVPIRNFTGLTKSIGNPIINCGFTLNAKTVTAIRLCCIININGTYYAIVGISYNNNVIYPEHYIYTSSDRITWSRVSDDPVLITGAADKWDYQLMLGKSVVLVNGVYYWYYSAYNNDNTACHIGVASSSSFINNWTKYASNPIYTMEKDSNNFVYAPSAILIGNTIYVFYSTLKSDYSIMTISYATAPSTNPFELTYGGIVLEHETGDWLSKFIDPYVIKNNDNNYEMVFASSASDPGSYKQYIGYAISDDAIHYIKTLSPILAPGESGSWDENQLGEPILTDEGDGELFYLGVSSEPILAAIGLAK